MSALVTVYDDYGQRRELWPEVDPPPERDAAKLHHLARLNAMMLCATMSVLYARATEHYREEALDRLATARELREKRHLVHVGQQDRLAAMSIALLAKAELHWAESCRWLAASRAALVAEYDAPGQFIGD